MSASNAIDDRLQQARFGRGAGCSRLRLRCGGRQRLVLQAKQSIDHGRAEPREFLSRSAFVDLSILPL